MWIICIFTWIFWLDGWRINWLIVKVMKFLNRLGLYIIFIRKAFSRPEKRSVYTKELMSEFEKLGLT